MAYLPSASEGLLVQLKEFWTRDTFVYEILLVHTPQSRLDSVSLCKMEEKVRWGVGRFVYRSPRGPDCCWVEMSVLVPSPS